MPKNVWPSSEIVEEEEEVVVARLAVVLLIVLKRIQAGDPAEPAVLDTSPTKLAPQVYVH